MKKVLWIALIVIAKSGLFAIPKTIYKNHPGASQTVSTIELGHADTGSDFPGSKLPVTFNYFKANIINKQLVVTWGTSIETNNDHFDIEISADAKNFKPLKTVSSKGINGDSTAHLDYIEAIDVSKVVVGRLSILWMGIVFLGRLKSRFAGISTIIFIYFVGLSCKRETAEPGLLPGQSVYVRILQVDNDGTKTYSPIYKVFYKP